MFVTKSYYAKGLMPHEGESNIFFSPTHEGGGKKEKRAKREAQKPPEPRQSFGIEEKVNVEEARIDDQLLRDPERVLREFTATPPTQGKKGWHLTLYEHLRARLDNAQDRYYFGAMKNWVQRWENEERNRIVSAALMFELDHRHEMGDQKYFNPPIVFDLALDAAGQKGSSAKTLDEYLKRIPLREIESVLLPRTSKQKGEIEEREKLRLARAALRRQDTEPQDAQRLLAQGEGILHGWIKEWTDDFEWRRQRHGVVYAGQYASLHRFLEPRNAELFDHVLADLPEKEHVFIEDLLEATSERVSPLMAGQGEMRYVNEHGDHLYQSSPAFQELCRAWGILTKAEREEQKQQRAKETQRAKEAKAKQERVKQIKDRAFFRDHLAECTVDASHFRVADDALWRLPGEPSWALPRIEDPVSWRVFSFPSGKRSAMSYNGLSRTVDHLEAHTGRVGEKGGEVRAGYEQRRAVLEQQLRALVQEKSGEIFHAILPKAPDANTATTDELERYVSDLERVIAMLEREREQHTNSSFRNDLLQNLHERFVVEHQPWEARVHERQQQEEEQETAKEAIRKEIQEKTEYLLQLYRNGTGLHLPPLTGNVLEIEGQNIGKVAVGGGGGGLGLGFELRQELRLLNEQDGIFLEMGEDIQAMERRKAMVDWIAPHEIAHLVDWNVPENTDRLLKEAHGDPKLLETLQRKGVGTQLQHDLKECVIDGLGFRMLREHGTSNPEATSYGQRLAAAIDGFHVAQEVFYSVLDHAEPQEKKNYTMTLLRMIAVGEQLKKRAGQEHGDTSRIDSTVQELNRRFRALNKETDLRLSRKDQQAILDLCSTFFKKAETIQFKKSS